MTRVPPHVPAPSAGYHVLPVRTIALIGLKPVRRHNLRLRCRRWVKNGPDALEIACLYYPRKQTSVSYAADCDVIVCYGGAKLVDKHFSSTASFFKRELSGNYSRERQIPGILNSPF
jgi:hypothetical protein